MSQGAEAEDGADDGSTRRSATRIESQGNGIDQPHGCPVMSVDPLHRRGGAIMARLWLLTPRWLVSLSLLLLLMIAGDCWGEGGTPTPQPKIGGTVNMQSFS